MQIKEVNIKKTLSNFPAISKEQRPVFQKDDYLERIEKLRKLMDMKNLTHVIVYGDREHFSNIFYFTGFDPRFEEALLVIPREEKPVLIAGNEGMDYAEIIPYSLKKVLYQSFSLMGQARSKNKELKEIIKSTGINDNSQVGLIGWKYFQEQEIEKHRNNYEVPFFIVDSIMKISGREQLVNATDLMQHPEYGLRIQVGLKELVLHEIAGTKTSKKVFSVIDNLKEGMTEIEASRFLNIDGEPLAVHPNVNFGMDNVLMGLASPQNDSILEKGKVVNIALGYRRGLVARTGLFVDSEQEIPSSMKGIVEELYQPYFELLTTWYESVKLGVTGGEIYSKVKKTIGSFEKYGIGLNPGHLINTDEWTNSIFYENSEYQIKSGMPIQCDIIAFPGAPFGGTHIEDGIVIADRSIRTKMEEKYPDSWKRIKLRKKFMKDTLGIDLPKEILPTSNIQGMLFPYMKNTDKILTN